MGDIDFDRLLAARRNRDLAPDGSDPRRRHERTADNSRVKDDAYLAEHDADAHPATTRLGSLADLEGRVNLAVKVAVLYTPSAEQERAGIHQTGTLSDASGSIRFSSWVDSSPPTLEEWRVYRIEGALIGRYFGRPVLVLDAKTSVSSLSEAA